MDITALPPVNASLNATSAFLLVLGYIFIKQRAITAHTMAMLAALTTSVLFLILYLIYHYYHGTTRFPGHGAVRVFYFSILISHTILAVVQVPLIISTLFHAFRGNFLKHLRVARITFPIWLYVSVTGVVVYWMLYRIRY